MTLDLTENDHAVAEDFLPVFLAIHNGESSILRVKRGTQTYHKAGVLGLLDRADVTVEVVDTPASVATES